jgi:large subunit ribosomal protein L10
MKAEKTDMIESLVKRVNASPFLFIVDYTGLTVPKWEELRKRLRTAGSEIHVFKNNLVRKAAEKAGCPSQLGDILVGQTAVVTGERDVCAAAKIVKTFAKEFEKPKLKGGVLDGALLTAEGINSLADLPSKEVLQSQLLGVLQAPASKLVRLLNEPAASLARVIKAKGEKGD